MQMRSADPRRGDPQPVEDGRKRRDGGRPDGGRPAAPQGGHKARTYGFLSVLTLASTIALSTAVCAQDSKYPDWRGQWQRASGVQWDPTKPPARGQQVPLTAEYQVIYDKALKEQQTVGGQDYNPQIRCIPSGMPRAMIAYEPLEILVTPEVTYVRDQVMSEFRRIYTDGRDWPQAMQPAYIGNSIGRWVDSTGSGRFDTLEAETRGFRGPRIIDNTGIPLHLDNETVIKERISLDRSNADTLNDEITLIDHAFTRPWTVTRNFRRDRKAQWIEYLCRENNNYLILQGQSYFITQDGQLMPMSKDEAPPDLRNFTTPAR
jgi:hypothetical protein